MTIDGSLMHFYTQPQEGAYLHKQNGHLYAYKKIKEAKPARRESKRMS